MSLIQRIRNSSDWHLETAGSIWQLLPKWVLLLPLIWIALIVGLNQTPLTWVLEKSVAELVSPSILAIAFLLSLVALGFLRPSYYRWLALFALALFLRELHFYGTDNGFYIAFILLIWWASRYRDRLTPFIQDPRIIGLLVAMILTYGIAKTFDRNYWEWLIHDPLLIDKIEENLEVMGHLNFLVLVLFSMRRIVPKE